MRLTLRTLLAYLDDAIDPAEAKDFGKKIEESEFASGLVQRLRTVGRKPRLPAPKVDGKGLGHDANTVAEYIESTLPTERVPEFERLCIESDMHLAEVAATHQILTLVLGRPSKVSQELRERIYHIPAERPAPRPAAEDHSRITPEPVESNGEPIMASLKGPLDASPADESLHDVPEYLRASKARERTWMLLAVTAAVGFLLTAIVLRAMGPFDGSHPIARMLGSRPQQIASLPPEPPPPLPPEVPTEPDDGTVVPPAEVEEPATVKEPTPTIPMPVELVEPEPLTPMDPLPPPPIPPLPEVENPAVPVVPQPGANPDEVASLPADPLPTKPAIPGVDFVPMPPKPEVPPTQVEVPMDVGRFISEEQVLARFDPQTKLWVRVRSKSLLSSGEQLVSLPVFRSLIALPSGVQVTVIGETHFQMLTPGDMGAPRMQIDRGRLTVLTDGVPGGKLALVLGGKELLATLNDADSMLAVEVRRYLPPGSDPQNDPAQIVLELFAVNGHVDLALTGGGTLELRPNHVLTIIDDDMSDVTGPFEPPAWVDVRGERDIDREAARVMEKELLWDRTLPVALTEKLQDRRVEVRSLAARALANLNEYTGILNELSDVRQATFWGAELDTIRMLLSSSPETAARIQQAVDRRYGMQAANVYRMLWGYSPEQLVAGGGTDLVKSLESAEVERRVVAAYTLERITGTNHAYRASGRPETNRPAITRFNQRLADGDLIYRVAPGPRSEFKPLAPVAP